MIRDWFHMGRFSDKLSVSEQLLSAGWPKQVVDEYSKQGSHFSSSVYSELGSAVVVSCSSLSKSFGSRGVLSNVSFSVNRGEFVGVLGNSGSGKTTLLQLLAGFLEPDAGKSFVHLRGGPLNVLSAPRLSRKLFGFSSQHVSFYPELTVEENVAYFAKIYGISSKTRSTAVKLALKLSDLDSYRSMFAGSLSGGLQRRLDIACSIVHSPRVLLLDEPVADLDPSSRKKIWSLVKNINRQGTTVIATSHLVGELADVSSRLFALRNGSIVELSGSSSSGGLELSVEFVSGRSDSLVSALTSLSVPFSIVKSGKRLVLQSDNFELLLNSVLNSSASLREQIIHLSISSPSLDEHFAEIAGVDAS